VADIVIRSVSKSFDRGRVMAVQGVDLTVKDGELFVLLGPSGCGKTTMLRMIAGLDLPDAGTVTIGERDVTMLPPRRRDIAMVFQSYAIFPHLTVFQNIAFGLRMKKASTATITERVRWAADLVELTDYLERRPAQLSGGQRQRVAVARAIAVGPAVLLMDEPLSNLDALLRLKFRSDLKKLVHELKTTTIYVTHDQVEALSLGDRMAVMRDGQIVQCDTPLRVYDRPASTFVGGFIGNPPMNFLPVTVRQVDGHLQAQAGLEPEQGFALPEYLRQFTGQPLLAGIRAENVRADLRRIPGSVRAEVAVVEPLGSQTLVTVTIAGQPFKVLTATDFTVSENTSLWIRPVSEKIRWFHPDSQEEIQLESQRQPSHSTA
jgi:multiple sugar transport system ATP-binding protein